MSTPVPKAGERGRDVPQGLVREGPQDRDLDDVPGPFSLFRRREQALQEPDRLANGHSLGSRQKHPGQGDVLELAQVTEVVIRGQALLTCPAEGFTESALRDPDPCPVPLTGQQYHIEAGPRTGPP